MTTEVFCDQEFDTFGTSSVIRHVYYSTKERKLFVELTHGYVIAGYADVDPEIFSAMAMINESRLRGDAGASVGRYWNQYVKGHFSGIEMDDVEVVTQRDLDLRASFKPLAEEQPAELLPFAVTIEEEEDDENTALTVFATDYKRAIEKVHQAAAILGWEPVKVVSVTQYFN